MLSGSVVRQVIQLTLRTLERGNVGEHRHVVTDTPLLVVDHADALPLRVDFAALAPVPHLATPGAAALQGMPQTMVEGRVVTPGFEQGGALAENFLAVVAGDAAEGRVDVNDALLGIGDQNAFLSRIEDGCGLAQAVIKGALPGDVTGDADEALRLAVFVAQQAAARVNPAITAISVAHAVGVLVIAMLQVDFELLQHLLAIIGVQVGGPLLAGIAERGFVEAEQCAVTVRVENALGGYVQVPQAVTGCVQCQAQALFAGGQRLLGAAIVHGVPLQDGIEQDGAEAYEEQALERLQGFVLGGGEQVEQVVAEQHPEQGSQQVGQGQAQGGSVDVHGEQCRS